MDGAGKMLKYNVIVVMDETDSKVLMCRRRKPPYAGLLNFVGGKVEKGEDGFTAAYRELKEETSIIKEDIILVHLMDFIYYAEDCYMEVYGGKLNKPVIVSGEENDLCWCSMKEDFFERGRFAGNGNVGHIISLLMDWRKKGTVLL